MWNGCNAFADTASTHFNEGYHHYQSWLQNHQPGELDNAISEMEAAHKAAPKSPIILQWIGFLQIAKGNYAEAIDPLQQATILAPKQGLPYVDLGFAYHKLGLFSEAAEALQHALQIYGALDKPDVRGPYLYRCYFDLGAVYFDAAKQAKDGSQKADFLKLAAAAYQQAAALPESASVTAPTGIPSLSPQELDRAALYIALASTLLQLGNLPQAADAAQKATQLAPDRQSAWRLLGYIRLKESSQYEGEKFPPPTNAREALLSQAQAAFEKALALSPKDYEAREGLARIYLVQSKYSEAYQAFQQAAADRADMGQAPNQSATVLYDSAVAAAKSGHTQNALSLFQRLLSSNPNNADALAWLGALYLQQKQYGQAIEPLTKTLALQPNNTAARLNLASAHMGLQNYSQAEENLRSLAQQEPNSPLIFYMLGTTQAKQGHYAESAENLRRYAQLDPLGQTVPNGDGFCALGDALQHLNERGAAEMAYLQATKVAPSNAVAWHNLGILTLEDALAANKPSSDPIWQTAQAALENAVRFQPNDYEALEAQALLLTMRGNDTEAVQKLHEAISLDPHPFNALVLLAKTESRLTHYQEADKAFKQALRIQPNNADIGLAYSQNLLAQQRYNQAAQVLRPFYTASPSNMQVALFYARSLQRAGDLPEALQVLKQACTLPQHGRQKALAYRMLGYLWLQKGGRQAFLQAQTAYKQALSEDPNNPEALNGLGLALLKLGKPKEALPYFKRAIAADPSYVDALNNIGVAREQLGDIPGALGAFRRALQTDPSNTIARENIARYRGWIHVFGEG